MNSLTPITVTESRFGFNSNKNQSICLLSALFLSQGSHSRAGQVIVSAQRGCRRFCLPLGALALLLASPPELLPFVQSPGGALGVRSLESPHGPAASEPAGALRKQPQAAMAAVGSPIPPGSSAPAGLFSELGAGFSQPGAAPSYKPGKGVGDGCGRSDGLQSVGPE